MFAKNDYGSSLLDEQQITGLNKLPYHATAVPFQSQAQALAGGFKDSPYYYPLNGMWKFRYCKTINDIPERFYDDSAEGWDVIPVPANWQLHGYGSPAYINTRYAFEPDRLKLTPPYISPKKNAAGLYKVSFTLPASFAGRQTILCFNGVESSLTVYINGKKAGYSANGRSPAEFCVTKLLIDGINELAVCVTQYSAASFLECQDMWRLSGIIRDVYLYSVPDVQLYDYFAYCDWNDEGAVLRLETKVLNHTEVLRPPCFITAEIFDMKAGRPEPAGNCGYTGYTGNISSRWHEVIAEEKPQPVNGRSISTAYISIPVADPMLWNPEQPELYTVILSLRHSPDDTQEAAEVLSFRYGFRRAEIIGGELFLNGVSIKLKGVNRHEFNHIAGHVVTRDDMITDICLMKQNNINAVRCSHYTNDGEWYDLCDEYGLMIMDEANVESHGMSYRRNLLPGNDPRWLPPLLDRVSAMVQSNKNHPCIIMWSLGNELGFGENVAIAAAYCKAYDHTRLVHKRQMNIVADMDSETYPTPGNMIERALRNPSRAFLANEYAHAMGNAMGNFKEYWEAIYAHKQLIGGFVWEWCDHGLLCRDEKGRPMFAYGGDFNEPFHDGNFCIDGIVTADRRPTAKLAELKKAHEFVRFEPVLLKQGRIKIKNQYGFINLNQFVLKYALLEDGTVIQAGMTEGLSAGAGQSEEVIIPYSVEKPICGAEYILSLSLVHKEATQYCDAGHEAAFEQFVLPHLYLSEAEFIPDLPVSAEESGSYIRIYSDIMEIIFDKSNGALIKYKVKGTDYILADGFKLNVFRAPTDNDMRNSCMQEPQNWISCGLDSLKVNEGSAFVEEINSKYVTAGIMRKYAGNNCSFAHYCRVTIFGNGRILMKNRVTPNTDLPLLPRIGVMLAMPKEFDKMEWYGKGPLETYPDRQSGGRYGRYTAAVSDDWCACYEKPQECGNHEDVRKMALYNNESGLMLLAHSRLSSSAMRYTPKKLAAASHLCELMPDNAAYWYIDAAQLGLGNRSCGSEPLPEYHVTSIEYNFDFSLVPIYESGPMPAGRDCYFKALMPLKTETTKNTLDISEISAESTGYRDPSDPDERRRAGFMN